MKPESTKYIYRGDLCMDREKHGNLKTTSHSYYLTPRQLEEIYRKYGRPGELAPGRPATRKRRRLDETLAAMDRRENSVPLLDDDLGF